MEGGICICIFRHLFPGGGSMFSSLLTRAPWNSPEFPKFRARVGCRQPCCLDASTISLRSTASMIGISSCVSGFFG